MREKMCVAYLKMFPKTWLSSKEGLVDWLRARDPVADLQTQAFKMSRLVDKNPQ